MHIYVFDVFLQLEIYPSFRSNSDLVWSGFVYFFFFFQAEDGIRDLTVTGVQTCALPIFDSRILTTLAPSVPSALLGYCSVDELYSMHLAKWRISSLRVLFGTTITRSTAPFLWSTSLCSMQSSSAVPSLPTTVTSRCFSMSSQLSSMPVSYPPGCSA